jgi:hypothetical protein
MRLFLLALAALFAFAPGAANAHRGSDHAAASSLVQAQQASARAAPVGANEAPAWSRPCPGGAGSKCCCESPPACSASAKPPAAGCSGWLIVPASSAAAARPLAPRPAPRSLLALLLAHPRAPPSFS